MPTGVPEPGTDVGALAEGFISVTPLQLDLTAYRMLSNLNTWHWNESSHEAMLLEVSQEMLLSR
jgi:5'-nucleotidase